MLDIPIVISFYTKNTLYQLEVQNLIESCERLGLEKSIDGVESFGAWELNCAYKPFFILQKIKELQRPVLWVDSDGVFQRLPEPIAAFSADLATRINGECPDEHPSKVISSTVFVNYTEGGLAIVREWAQECHRQLSCYGRTQEFWDQIALRDVILKKQLRNIAALPLAYARIFDHPQDLQDTEPPVIEHYQASRRLKKTINQTIS